MMRLLIILLLGCGSGVTAYRVYFHMLAPAYGARVEPELGWARAELKLSDAQFAKIMQIHERYLPLFRTLSTELVKTRKLEVSQEKLRRDKGVIDFIAFKHLLDEQARIEDESCQSTLDLASRVAGELTPEQRDQYFKLLEVGKAFRLRDPDTTDL